MVLFDLKGKGETGENGPRLSTFLGHFGLQLEGTGKEMLGKCRSVNVLPFVFRVIGV